MKVSKTKIESNNVNLKIDENTFHIGCHLSSSKGFVSMVKEMEYVGGNTFQYFSRNPRGSKMKALDLKDIEKFLELRESHSIKYVLAHAPYTLNPASDKEEVREFAKLVLDEDIDRLEYIKGAYYNFHPGSHVGQGSEKGIEIITEAINRITDKCQKTTVLLETMAGKGTEIGRTFEEIATIIDKVENKDVLGVCMDTCHIYDGGYDIVNSLDEVLSTFDKVIGLNKLKAIHINDSKNPFSSHKDRHEKIGEGTIGLKAMENIINHKFLKDLPFYLETPNELDGYKDEITLLKSLKK